MSDPAGDVLRGLPADERAALRFAALLGDEMRAADLANVLGLSGDQVAELVAAGVAAGVLSGGGERVTFRQASVRAALAGQVPPAIRLGLCEHFAHELARADPVDDRVPGLLADAADPLRAWVVDWLATVPEGRLHAAPGAHVDLLARALRVVPVDEPRWAGLAGRSLLVSFWLGQDHAVVGGTADVLARTADPGTAARLRIQLMRSLCRLGRHEDAVRVAGLAATDPLTPPHWRARGAAWQATALARLGRTDLARAAAEAALRVAAFLGDRLGIAYVLAKLGCRSRVELARIVTVNEPAG